MKVHLYMRRYMQPGRPGPDQNQIPNAIEGFRRHGIEPVVLPAGQSAPCDLAVVWGVRFPTDVASGRRYLVFERAYVGDRYYWTSIGFDGLNGYADFRNSNSPSDRWEKYFAGVMQPWRGHEGKHVLIAGQKPGDQSLRGLNTFEWCIRVATEIESAGRAVKVRRHPKAQNAMYPFRDVMTYGERMRVREERLLAKRIFSDPTCDIAQDLQNASWLVTYNSNSAVDAVLAGVPAVTCDPGSMAWPVTGHDPTSPPPMPDRTQWAYDLAYTQWSPDEVRNGDAWDHLRGGMEVA